MPEHIAILDRYPTGTPAAKKGGSTSQKNRLTHRAAKCASTMAWLPAYKYSPHFLQRLEKLNQKLQSVFAAIRFSVKQQLLRNAMSTAGSSRISAYCTPL